MMSISRRFLDRFFTTDHTLTPPASRHASNPLARCPGPGPRRLRRAL